MSKKLIAQLFTTKLAFTLSCLTSRAYNFLNKQILKKNDPLPNFYLLRELELAVMDFVWDFNEFKLHLFEFPHLIIQDANIVQWRLNRGMVGCHSPNEFATYAATALKSVDEAINPQVLMVRWIAKDGTLECHNVAIYKYKTKKMTELYGMMGNWGHYRGFKSVERLATEIAWMGGGKLVSYAIATPSLKLVHYDRI